MGLSDIKLTLRMSSHEMLDIRIANQFPFQLTYMLWYDNISKVVKHSQIFYLCLSMDKIRSPIFVTMICHLTTINLKSKSKVCWKSFRIHNMSKVWVSSIVFNEWEDKNIPFSSRYSTQTPFIAYDITIYMTFYANYN